MCAVVKEVSKLGAKCKRRLTKQKSLLIKATSQQTPCQTVLAPLAIADTQKKKNSFLPIDSFFN